MSNLSAYLVQVLNIFTIDDFDPMRAMAKIHLDTTSVFGHKLRNFDHRRQALHLSYNVFSSELTIDWQHYTTLCC